MAPKVRIEDVLPTGEKIVITLEGATLSKNRVLQVLDMLSIMKGEVDNAVEERSLKERIWDAIVERFGDGRWFTTRDAYQAVRVYEPEAKLNVVAAYLARFVSEGRLAKRGRKPSTMYRVKVAVARV